MKKSKPKSSGGGVMVVICIVAVIGLLILSIKITVDRYKWLSQHCEVMGKISGSSSMGPAFGTDGKVSFVQVYTPGKTGYKCDDGLEYWE